MSSPNDDLRVSLFAVTSSAASTSATNSNLYCSLFRVSKSIASTSTKKADSRVSLSRVTKSSSVTLKKANSCIRTLVHSTKQQEKKLSLFLNQLNPECRSRLDSFLAKWVIEIYRPKKELVNKLSFFLHRLDRGCRFLIFDALMDPQRTIKLAPDLEARSPRAALSQTSHSLRDEIRGWSNSRPNLIRSSSFGLYNPLSTSFHFSFKPSNFHEKPFTLSRVYRVYHPTAAIKHSQLLDSWQGSLTASYERAKTLPTGDEGARYESLDEKAKAVYLRARSDHYRAERISGIDSISRTNDDLASRMGGSSYPETVKLFQHVKDGVEDVLVLDFFRYRDVEDAKEVIKLLSLRRLHEKFKFAWTDEWENWFEHKRVEEDEEVLYEKHLMME